MTSSTIISQEQDVFLPVIACARFAKSNGQETNGIKTRQDKRNVHRNSITSLLAKKEKGY